MGPAAELLLEARRRSGLSQAELARRAGITRSVLNAYERGRREPGVGALNSILRATGLELSLAPRIDVERNARILDDVLDLAELLPFRRKAPLPRPRKRAG